MSTQRPRDITEGVLDIIRQQARNAEEGFPAPIIEITLRGRLGIPNSLLEMQKMRDETKKITGALHVRVKNHSVPVEYAVAEDMEEDASREKLERRVIEDLIVRDNRYKTRVEDMARVVIGVKRQALSDESPEKIVEFISLELGHETGGNAPNRQLTTDR